MQKAKKGLLYVETVPRGIELKKGYCRARIQSNPSGATLKIDGIQKGTTPLQLDSIQAGEYTLTIDLLDYATIHEKIMFPPKYLLYCIEATAYLPYSMRRSRNFGERSEPYMLC